MFGTSSIKDLVTCSEYIEIGNIVVAENLMILKDLELPKCMILSLDSNEKCSGDGLIFDEIKFLSLKNFSFKKIVAKECISASFTNCKNVNIEAVSGGTLIFNNCKNIIVSGKWQTITIINCDVDYLHFENVDKFIIKKSKIKFVQFPKVVSKITFHDSECETCIVKVCGRFAERNFKVNIFEADRIDYDSRRK